VGETTLEEDGMIRKLDIMRLKAMSPKAFELGPRAFELGPRAFQFMRRYIASSGVLFFGVGAQFVWFILLARRLGAEGFGQLMVILAVTALAGSMCGVGSCDAMVRRVARNRDDYGLMLGHGLILIGVTGAALVVACTAVLYFLTPVDASPAVNLAIMAVYSFTYVFLATLVWSTELVFIGRGEFGAANFINGGFSAIRMVTAIVACLGFGVSSIGGWAAWNCGAHLISALVCAWMLKPLGAPVWRVERRELWLGFQHSTPVLVDTLRSNVDRIVLGAAAPALVVGNYAMASRMAQISQLVVHSLNRIMYPTFAARIDQGMRGMARVGMKYVAAVGLLSFATAVGVFIVAPVMPLLLGESYRNVVHDLRVLCWLVIPMAVVNVPFDLFGAADRHGTRAKVYNTVSLIGVAATAGAVWRFGVQGAFVAAYGVQIALAASLWAALLAAAKQEELADAALAGTAEAVAE
jgi:O-antigen/teichoic acid export membrane protein